MLVAYGETALMRLARAVDEGSIEGAFVVLREPEPTYPPIEGRAQPAI